MNKKNKEHVYQLEVKNKETGRIITFDKYISPREINRVANDYFKKDNYTIEFVKYEVVPKERISFEQFRKENFKNISNGGNYE